MTTPRTSRETQPDPPTDGLDRLDRERASSVADEGGASGAALEGEDDALGTVPDQDGRPIPRWSEEGRRRARKLRKPLLVVALIACSTSAQAAGYFTPFLGAAFGGRTDDSKLTYGGSLTLAGESGIVGFAVDFGYTPNFLGYFRQLTDPAPDGEFDVDLGSLDFWRASGGLAVHF